ncbi:nucleoside 2-deoxyribosyltransferase domain-containing protein [Aquimarina sp. 2201CG5-10]|uniref:nucleoside 2-deoxyribosyltransferase domain-containing protein n=1 Tax=Aquimarina callyspongiae TaxID=3098150 RepID=UPI002AB3AA49|nr:nucleoside 2-deoxyribosyltransferase domain-containing protein [Aquimarina sp. 2201CG5-10]MDY8137590.1 nucleoside 2-deoxyribosyltransferase domain-containing protein [Aquimarina sp. 2201CG5-10]
MNSRIFLGGTCAGTKWRDEIEKIVQIPTFNPVVDDWTPECQEIEIDEKENRCDVHLYVITSEMQGVFSIAEVIDSVHNKSKKTLLHVMPNGLKSTN